MSGNVSLYNVLNTGTIPASPIIACVGGLDDVSQSLLPDSSARFTLRPMGTRKTRAAVRSLPEPVNKPVAYCSAPIHYDRALREIALFRAAADAGLIRSARSIGNGGLVTAIAQMIFPSGGSEAIGVQMLDTSDWSGAAGELEAYFGEWGGLIVETDDAAALRTSIALAKTTSSRSATRFPVRHSKSPAHRSTCASFARRGASR